MKRFANITVGVTIKKILEQTFLVGREENIAVYI